MKRLAILIALAACDKGGGKAASPRDIILEAWKKGGLDVGEFKAATADVGKDCASGTVSKHEVLICAFASDDEAKKAEDLGLKWVGDTTGASHAKNKMVIAVADRHKADPSGKTINQIFKLVP